MKESSDQKGGKLVCKQKNGLQYLSIFTIRLKVVSLYLPKLPETFGPFWPTQAFGVRVLRGFTAHKKLTLGG